MSTKKNRKLIFFYLFSFMYYVVNGDWKRNERNWFQNGSFTDIVSSLTKRDKYWFDFNSFKDEYWAPIVFKMDYLFQ